MSIPPISPPSSHFADSFAKLVTTTAITSERASERASNPRDQEAQDRFHSSISAVKTPPHTSQESFSSLVPEPEHEQHKHKHNQQTQNIIQRLCQRKDRIPSQLSWQVLPLNHSEFAALYRSIKAQSARLAAHFEDKVRYDYFYERQRFVLRMPISSAHELVVRDIDAEIVRQLRGMTFLPQATAIKSLGSPTIHLPDDPNQERDHGYNVHSPDATFGLANEEWPGVILEVANTQKAKFLDQIADNYIIGSKGHIRVLLAVKLSYRNSKKATLSMWKSHMAQNDQGKWEHSCQNTMREVVRCGHYILRFALLLISYL